MYKPKTNTYYYY